MRIADRSGAPAPTPSASTGPAPLDAAARTPRSPPRQSRRALAFPLAAALVALVATAIYLPHLDTGFASEDFLILARLSQRSLTATIHAELTSAWLGLGPVGFWRPASTVLLAIELRLFGLAPARFHAAHLLEHALCAWLVAQIVAIALGWRTQRSEPLGALSPQRLESAQTAIAIAAAALFTLHPFHPSAVLFTGAFATLHAALFSLLAIALFLAGGREPVGRRRRARDLAALAAFVLALGCYEAAAVLPVALFAAALLLPSPPRADRPRQGVVARAATRTAPYFAVLLGYLALRLAVLGTTVGGYAAFRERFVSSPLARAADLAAAIGRIVDPRYDATSPALVGAAFVAAVVIAVVMGAPVAARRAALLGLIWIAVFLAPFAFVGLVPANGRYAYLAIAGGAVAIGASLDALVVRWPRVGTTIAVVAVLALAADWASALHRVLASYDEASDLGAAVRGEVLAAAADRGAGDTLLLIESAPDFVKGPGGEPVAKVFQYGLAESVTPPFGPLRRPPVPVPASISRAASDRLAALPGAVRYRWDPYARRLMPAQAAAQAAAPAELERGSFDRSRGEIEAGCRDCSFARLVVLTPALPFVLAPVAVDTAAHRVRFAVEHELLHGLDDASFTGDSFFWIEERRDGGASAISPVARFALGAGATESFAEAAAKIRRGSSAMRTGVADEPRGDR